MIGISVHSRSPPAQYCRDGLQINYINHLLVEELIMRTNKLHVLFTGFMIISILILMSCSQDKSLTPNRVEVELSEQNGVSSLAKDAPEVSTFSVSFPSFNPCTEMVHIISADITERNHSFGFDQTDGNHHFNVLFQFDVVTNDGFSGSGVQRGVDNGTNPAGPPTEEFSFTSIVNINLSNASGQRIKTQSVFLITIRNGQIVRAEVDKSNNTCVGKP